MIKKSDIEKSVQPRWRSKILWGSIVAQLLVILQLTGLLDRLGLDAGLFNDVAAAVLQMLVLVGVLNDPTNKTGF